MVTIVTNPSASCHFIKKNTTESRTEWDPKLKAAPSLMGRQGEESLSFSRDQAKQGGSPALHMQR